MEKAQEGLSIRLSSLFDCRVGTLDERHVFDSGRSDELPGIGGVWGWAVSTST